jgi:hypothetical protein
MVCLAERKLRVDKPRQRRKGGGQGAEVDLPVYEAMQNDSRLGRRMLEILMHGVSTRNYRTVLPEMADTVGVAKSSVSREFIDASEEALKQLASRTFSGAQTRGDEDAALGIPGRGRLLDVDPAAPQRGRELPQPVSDRRAGLVIRHDRNRGFVRRQPGRIHHQHLQGEQHAPKGQRADTWVRVHGVLPSACKIRAVLSGY